MRKDIFDEYAEQLSAQASLTFSQCRTASSWSVPSHASILTGILPHQHGIHSGNCDYSTLDIKNTFLSNMNDHRTFGVSSNAWVGSPFGFDQLFDEFEDISPTRYFSKGIDVRTFEANDTQRYHKFIAEAFSHDHTLASLANGVITKLDSLTSGRSIPKIIDYGSKRITSSLLRCASRSEPFFAFANLMEAHTPHENVRMYDNSLHNVENSWHSSQLNSREINVDGILEKNMNDVESFRDIYTASVEYLDRTLSTVINDIQKKTSLETTVIVTADHGENLCYPSEDRLFGHKSSLSEGLLHVPLIVINPPRKETEFNKEYVSHLDIGDFICQISQDNIIDITSDSIAAELIGMGFDTWELDPESYRWWNRMQRCAYRNNTKVHWDSLGNINEYIINKHEPSRQKERQKVNGIPTWASEKFEIEFRDYNQHLEEKNEIDEDQLDSRAEERLQDLGYL